MDPPDPPQTSDTIAGTRQQGKGQRSRNRGGPIPAHSADYSPVPFRLFLAELAFGGAGLLGIALAPRGVVFLATPIWLILAVQIGLMLPWMQLVRSLKHTYPKSPGTLVTINFWLSLMALGMLSTALIYHLNPRPDDAQVELRRELVVEGETIHSGSGRNRTHTHNLLVRDWRPDRDTADRVSIPVHRDWYAEAHLGDTLELEVHGGWLGIPWTRLVRIGPEAFR